MEQLYQKSVLSNGLRLVTEKIPTVHSVAFGVWVNVGGRDENAHNQGISHFLEHMIFKGTERRSKYDIALEIESVGGLINAMTMKENTCFYTKLLDENINTAVDVLSDIIANSLFSEEETVREKKVIIEEINSLQDTPEDLIFDYFYREIFPEHSLGLPILGNKETVSSIRSEDLRNLIREKYTVDNIVIAAAGNVEHNMLLELVEESFTFPKAEKNQRSEDIPSYNPGLHSWSRPVSQAHIVTGARGYRYSDENKYAFLLMNTILGGGMSSRLFQSIRENFGYAYAVYTFGESFSDTGVWGVYVGTDRDKVDDVLGLIEDEFAKLRSELVSKEEINRIKNQLKGNLMLGLESTASRMHRLAKMEMYLNKFIFLDEVINNINKVTPEQVKMVAEELTAPEKQLTVIFTPAEDKQ